MPPQGIPESPEGHCRRAPDSRHVVHQCATKRWDGLVGPQNAQGLGRRSTNIRDRVVQASDQSGEGLHRTEHAHGSAGRTPNDAILIVHQGGDGIDRSDVAEPSQSLTCRSPYPRIGIVEEGAYSRCVILDAGSADDGDGGSTVDLVAVVQNGHGALKRERGVDTLQSGERCSPNLGGGVFNPSLLSSARRGTAIVRSIVHTRASVTGGDARREATASSTSASERSGRRSPDPRKFK